MLKIASTFILLLFSFELLAQKTIKDFVTTHTVNLKSNGVDSINGFNLESIGDAIGNAKIVMLGEQTHGDGATFEVKAKLIKYLHEKKGFNILAFESDFFGLNAGWNHPESQQDPGAFVMKEVYTIWGESRQLKGFFQYISKTHQTSTPLKVTGFDCQVGTRYGYFQLKKYLEDYLKRQEVDFVQSDNYGKIFLPVIDTLISSLRTTTHNKATLKQLKEFQLCVDTILSQIKDNKDSFEFRLLENLKVFSQVVFFYTNRSKARAIRDEQMAKNLNWLANDKFKGEKIIVWAASSHVIKNISEIKLKDFRKHSMGTFFTKDSINCKKTYIIGFTSKAGVSGWKEITPVSKAQKNGFENWIDDEMDFAFADFKGFRNLFPDSSERFYMKALGHENNKAIWTKGFDGIIYIREMFPNERSTLN